MYIYHTKLVNNYSIKHAVSGNFSGRNRPEIIIAHNRILELLLFVNNGFDSYCREDLYARIHSLAVLKWKGRDLVAVGSDSGDALVLMYEAAANTFVPVYKRSLGLPTSLPEFPGQYVATSYMGFALGSLAENFLFYSLYNKDELEEAPFFLSVKRCIIFDFVGVEAPNVQIPMFVSLEVLCEMGVKDLEKLTQYLKVYELSIEKKKVFVTSHKLPEHGNMLISVPKGKENPFGVIICYGLKITFNPLRTDYKEVTRYLPQRKNDGINMKRGFLLTSSAIHNIEGRIIILAQSEQGDLFSIRIQEQKNKVLVMTILYIDTIPVASAMCMVSGRLFVAAEFGNK